MVYLKLSFAFLLIPSIISTNCALELEGILGGHPTRKTNFTYQAAIVGRYNNSYHRYLLCSAGILKDRLLIAALKCFMNSEDSLKKLAFSAVVGTEILTSNGIHLYEIEKIYHYFSRRANFDNAIAIVKSKESFSFENHSKFSTLDIPGIEETFIGQTAIVAGFGIHLIHDIDDRTKREQIQFTNSNGLLLRTAKVLIVNDGYLKLDHNNTGKPITESRNINLPFTDLCGVIPADEFDHIRGVCMGDNGAPLVIGRKVVGILSIHNTDCDDTIHGSIYIKVANLKQFIDAIIAENYISGTITYDNHPYVSRSRKRGKFELNKKL